MASLLGIQIPWGDAVEAKAEFVWALLFKLSLWVVDLPVNKRTAQRAFNLQATGRSAQGLRSLIQLKFNSL